MAGTQSVSIVERCTAVPALVVAFLRPGANGDQRGLLESTEMSVLEVHGRVDVRSDLSLCRQRLGTGHGASAEDAPQILQRVEATSLLGFCSRWTDGEVVVSVVD